MISTKGMDATFKEIMTENGFRPVPYNATRRRCGCVDTEIIESELGQCGRTFRRFLGYDQYVFWLRNVTSHFAVEQLMPNTPQRFPKREGW